MFGAIQGRRWIMDFERVQVIFVVPGPAQDNKSRREGDICLVAAANLTP
jgi:hypothetical protein